MKKQNIIMGISFVLLFVMVMGVSYAAYKFSAAGTKENVISTGTISMNYSQNSFIDLKNTYPKTDTYAIATKEDKSSMEFSVSMETSGTKQINYALAITNIEEGTTLKSDKVKIYLEKEGKVVNNFETNKGKTIESFKNKYVEGLIDSYAIYQDILTTSNKTHHYTLTAWIDESYILPIKNETTTTKETNKETYKFKVKVVGVDTPITIKEKSNVTIGVDTLIALTNNKDSSGLYTITHPKDTTLQIGANESITEYRYRGASPKNYVTFNNEVWRILGVFPTDDGSGNMEYRIKLIKNESIGDIFWNNCEYNNGTCDYTGKFLNDWTGATLNTYLNGTYLNSLDSTSKNLISNAKYYLGGVGTESLDLQGIVKVYQTTGVQLYSYERKIQNGNCSYSSDAKGYLGTGCYYTGTNPNSFTGKLGLMYSSDYFYASENCENKMMIEVTDNGDIAETSTKDIRACNDTNWLHNLKVDEWHLPQFTINSLNALAVYSGGGMKFGSVSGDRLAVRPVLYLTSSVQITGGNGTSRNPYKLKLEGISEETPIIKKSDANAPVLASNMIPVYYDETNDVWKKADESNTNKTNLWYSYESSGEYKGRWANAVTVKDTNRQTYLNAAPGTAISMDDINTMWVWIPRFNAVTPSNYNGGSHTFPNAIDVTFVKQNETAIDAFTFGNKQLSGFWYGKFETSHITLASSKTNNNLGCTNETCSNANGIIIKPNVTILRYNNISNFFFASRSMEQSNNSFGFVSSEVDTHMSKNNEWGAVAYLTQSIYGRCSNSITCTEIGINNKQDYITGYGAPAGSEKTVTNGAYNTILGKDASTTGNIYGIYDMSGGTEEYVMGVLADPSGKPRSGYTVNSGFTGMLENGTIYKGIAFPDSKYYNLYTGASYTGHGLTETKNWYRDYAVFVNSRLPWFIRGGSYDNSWGVGVFNFRYRDGSSNSFNSSRLVISNK